MNEHLGHKGSTSGAILLIVGCCVGAGMVGLPVVSATAGLIPTTLAMLLCYFFAVCTGLLILEATLWFDKKINLISMAGFALGKVGKGITWLLFLFLFYCLFVAYATGGGQLFEGLLEALFKRPISREVGILSCVLFTGLIAYGGTKIVSYIGRLFLFALITSFCALVAFGIPYIEQEKLLYTHWEGIYATLPILLVCFGYQNLIPTLTYYVHKDVKILRRAIIFGNLIPFSIYFIWNAVILGILPETNSLLLKEAVNQGELVTSLLEGASGSQAVLSFVKIFSFFGVLTPFIGNTLTFVDFLKDGFHMNDRQHRFYNKLIIYLLVLVPPTLVSLIYPHLFLKALGAVGGIVDVLLFGILPVVIVAIGRYVKKIEGPYVAPGGKYLLCIVFLLSILFLSIK